MPGVGVGGGGGGSSQWQAVVSVVGSQSLRLSLYIQWVKTHREPGLNKLCSSSAAYILVPGPLLA